jgi:murein L,D-transpeptidase YafK
MTTSFVRAGLLLAILALAGCNETLEDIAPKAEKSLPPAIVQSMRAQGMTQTSPIMVRMFKEEAKLEVWKRKDNGRYDLVTSYDICKWSGQLGPKFTEGDRQAPEGFYTVRPHQMNPKSQYHLAFNMGFPNSFDRVNGRTGTHLMVHGACSSAGCYSMSDPQMEQIYAFARDAFKGGQTEFQIQAFPFRMNAANMARYKNDPNIQFWTMLKEGYDHFEITKVPPKVDVCGKRYVFNQQIEAGRAFSPAAACPVSTQPESLRVAYAGYKAKYDAAFAAALDAQGSGKTIPVSESIDGLKEAAMVADWSRRRSRGERVMREPPTLERPEIMMADQARKVTPQMSQPAVAAVPTPAPVQNAQAPADAAMQATAEAAAAVPDATPQAEPAKPGLSRRLLGMFGG